VDIPQISQELAWSTVLGGWAPEYFECAIRHNALIDWHREQVVPEDQELEPEPKKKSGKWFNPFD